MAATDDLAIIKVHCLPDNPHALAGVLNTKKVCFDVETKSTTEATKRTPLNLVLILDRSGSMEAANKLTFAKKAVISVLNLLHDDDIVHLVVYDDQISIVFENARASTRQHLYSLVESVESNGSTNISGALEVGAGLLNKYVYEGFSRRMFLFSDGQANVGLKTQPELTKLVAGYNDTGIITDSFGIGADFNSEIMKGIADAGGSRFYYLSSADVIELLVTKALVCVFGVCASRASLVVRGKNGAVVTKIWGHDDLIAGASLGDLHVDNLRSVLCEFTVSGAANTEVEVLTYELRYNHPSDPLGTPTVIKKTLSIKFVEDETIVTVIFPRVKVMSAAQTVAEMDRQIAQYVRDGRRQEAMGLVEQQLSILHAVEQYEDEKGQVSLLLRLAEHMQKRLQDTTVNDRIISQGYEHQAYLKEDCDEEEMGFGLFD